MKDLLVNQSINNRINSTQLNINPIMATQILNLKPCSTLLVHNSCTKRGQVHSIYNNGIKFLIDENANHTDEDGYVQFIAWSDDFISFKPRQTNEIYNGHQSVMTIKQMEFICNTLNSVDDEGVEIIETSINFDEDHRKNEDDLIYAPNMKMFVRYRLDGEEHDRGFISAYDNDEVTVVEDADDTDTEDKGEQEKITLVNEKVSRSRRQKMLKTNSIKYGLASYEFVEELSESKEPCLQFLTENEWIVYKAIVRSMEQQCREVIRASDVVQGDHAIAGTISTLNMKGFVRCRVGGDKHGKGFISAVTTKNYNDFNLNR